MNWRLAACMSILLVLFLAIAQPTQGQSSSPTPTETPTVSVTPPPPPSITATPTPTPTVVLPAGDELLKKMSAAVLAKGSYHVVARSDVLLRGTMRMVQKEHGDLSLKPLRLHALSATSTTRLNKHPNTTSTQHLEMILVKNRMATRTRHTPWQCSNLKGLSAALGQVVTGIAGSTHVQSVDTVGPETVNAIPVWRVRVVETVALNGTDQTITGDYSIAQSDYTLVRETTAATLTLGTAKIHETLSSTYSRYGEKVKVALPGACGGKVTQIQASPLLSPAGLLSGMGPETRIVLLRVGAATVPHTLIPVPE